MQHKLSIEFFQYWKSCCHGESLPLLTDFPSVKLREYDECGLVFSLNNGDITIDYLGERNKAVLSKDLVGRPVTDLYPPALKAMQMALLIPCINQKIGLMRRSRLWFGHRHKDVEWLFLPVNDEARATVSLVGLSVTFVDNDERDTVTVGSPLVERIIRQNYLYLGQDITIPEIDSHSWAVLDSMGARITVEGKEIPHDDRGIAGSAGLIAAKASRSNVLAVIKEQDIGNVSERLGGRYNLRVVESFDEARGILKSDMIDILVTSETVNDARGIELIVDAQKISAFTACVMMLDQHEAAKDTRIEKDGSLVHQLIKPVGEFALRQALDDAGNYVDKARQNDAV